jgi:hypothetical protein
MFQKPDGRPPEYWRGMAEEARALAEGLATEANRQQMLTVAANYDDLAGQAEREQTPAENDPAAARDARASDEGMR